LNISILTSVALTCCAVLAIIIIDNQKRIVKAFLARNTGRNIPGHFNRSEPREQYVQKRGANKWGRNTPTERSKEQTDAKSTMRKNLQNTTVAE
jgi:hypothetical protein